TDSAISGSSTSVSSSSGSTISGSTFSGSMFSGSTSSRPSSTIPSPTSTRSYPFEDKCSRSSIKYILRMIGVRHIRDLMYFERLYNIKFGKNPDKLRINRKTRRMLRRYIKFRDILVFCKIINPRSSSTSSMPSQSLTSMPQISTTDSAISGSSTSVNSFSSTTSSTSSHSRICPHKTSSTISISPTNISCGCNRRKPCHLKKLYRTLIKLGINDLSELEYFERSYRNANRRKCQCKCFHSNVSKKRIALYVKHRHIILKFGRFRWKNRRFILFNNCYPVDSWGKKWFTRYRRFNKNYRRFLRHSHKHKHFYKDCNKCRARQCGFCERD
ncbi:hypothetical protein AYI69_g5609, partial [Smittium culicis]